MISSRIPSPLGRGVSIESLLPTSEQGQYWQQRLLEWDGNILPDSQEASVFESWYVELTKIPSEEIGEEFWDEPVYLREAVTPEEGQIAFDTVLNNFGDEIPVWGDIHKAVFNPPLLEVQPEASLEVPLGGDGYTVNVSSYDSEDFNSSQGVSYRQIIDFSNLENSLYINPPGNSGELGNPNYSDQLLLWQHGEYIPMTTEDYYIAKKSIFQPKST